MDIDLPAILFWVVLGCGVIWLADVLLLRQRRLEKDAEAPEPALVEYAKSFFPVLLLVLVLRSFVAEPYQIPSESMVPTLQVGDFILVNKYAYGLRLPVFGTKVVSVGEPQRGDVMVFIPPHDPRYFIKRVIGLPGDLIRYEGKALYINGERLPYKFMREFEDPTTGIEMREYTESIGGVDHAIFRNGFTERTRNWELGPGEYLMMGDNRDKSQDSRFWGPAREENIVGKAVAVWTHKPPGWSWPTFSQNRWIQ